ncbi:MAG: alpha/beta hydrolase [Anaerolineaceae bacterium]|nr:alpha/beta hydrolase [Anaerolineaceae bacterium]
MEKQKSKGRKNRMWPIAITIVVVLIFCWFSPSRFNTSDDLMINELIEVELNGSRQWISIRGTNLSNPVLLFLHGGPGSANITKLRVQCPELEDHFIVVNWDQRGAGKSYWAWLRGEHPTYAVLQLDTHELVSYLRNRFNGQKIYLMGFSWGSVLGLQTVHDYPEDFVAYIGVSQEVDFQQAEQLSLAYVQQTAQRLNDPKAIDELASINPTYQSEDWYDQLMRERKWLTQYQGVYHTTNNFNHEAMMLLKAPEYSLLDFAAWPISSAKSLQKIWPELMQVSMFDDVPSVEVPLYFLVGAYDQNAPSTLTESYYDFVNAPQGKQLIWFEESAHDIFYDQPDLLVQTVIGIKEDCQE